MRKRKNMLLSFILTLAMVMGLSVPSASAAKAIKLNTKKATITVGETKKIKVKNTKKKAKWSITKGKKYIKLTKKKKDSVTVKAKKKGKAVVQAKIGKKKLTCKITVVKKKKEKTITDNKNQRKASQTPSSPPAPTKAAPTASAPPNFTNTTNKPPVSATPEAVKNLVIDLSKCGNTVFTSSPAKINFSSQIDSRFDLSLYSSLKVSYKMTFEGNDSSDFNQGKIGLAKTSASLDGYGDGIKYTMNMTARGTSVSLGLTNLSGTVAGINIQPMNGDYSWPKKLTKISITGIEFIAKKGAVYPDPNKPSAPTPTPEPTYAPEEFNYEGTDISWIDKSKPMVAFTFDDGPVGNTDTSNSMVIQKALKKYGAHATFFYIGSQINSDARKDEILQAKTNGFEVGNHSWGWSSLSDMTSTEIKKSIGDTNAKLTEITGYNNFLFRPPNLSVSDTMKGYIKAPFINCSIYSKDWEKATKEQIIANVKKAADGDIVLMHETENNTKEAVEELLDYFVNEKGWQVVSVSELFAAKGKKLTTGTIYNNAK